MSSSISARLTPLPLSPELVIKTSGMSEVSVCPEKLTDELLLAQICEGNCDALALLFRRYAQHVRNAGHRILRDKAEAEDLVQEVFLYIHRKSALYDKTKGSARSWIIQVTYTQALLRRRQLKAQGFYVSGIPDKGIECLPAGDNGSHYDHTLEGLFGKNGWKKIVEDLTEDQRETFRLHFFEGYTFTEIADKLGQSYVNIRHHYYRGMEKLRKHVHGHGLDRR